MTLRFHLCVILIYVLVSCIPIASCEELENPMIIDLESTTYNDIIEQISNRYDFNTSVVHPQRKTVDVYLDSFSSIQFEFRFWKDDYYISSINLPYEDIDSYVQDIFQLSIDGIHVNDYSNCITNFPEATISKLNTNNALETKIARNGFIYTIYYDISSTSSTINSVVVERYIYPSTALSIESFVYYDIMHTDIGDTDIFDIEPYTESFIFNTEYIRQTYSLMDGSYISLEYNTEGNLYPLTAIYWNIGNNTSLDTIYEINNRHPENSLFVGKIITKNDISELVCGISGSLGQGPDYIAITSNGVHVQIFTTLIDETEIIYGLQYSDGTGIWLDGRSLIIYD